MEASPPTGPADIGADVAPFSDLLLALRSSVPTCARREWEVLVSTAEFMDRYFRWACCGGLEGRKAPRGESPHHNGLSVLSAPEAIPVQERRDPLLLEVESWFAGRLTGLRAWQECVHVQVFAVSPMVMVTTLTGEEKCPANAEANAEMRGVEGYQYQADMEDDHGTMVFFYHVPKEGESAWLSYVTVPGNHTEWQALGYESGSDLIT